MTPADVDRRVRQVLRRKGSKKDVMIWAIGLYRDLLEAIASGKCQSPANCATLALKIEGEAE